MTIYPRWYECDTCTRRVEVKAPELPDEIACPFCDGTARAMRQQTMEFRVDHLERTVRVLEAVVRDYGLPRTATPQEHAPRGTVAGESEHLRRMTTQPPDGVVSPHARANLERIALWTHPEAWSLQGSPEERVRTRAMLDHIHGMVMIAMTGEDVPTPGSAP